MSCKDFHKLKLVKQTYCQFLSEYNHVWEYDNYRVYVSSKGITLEVLPSLTLNEVKLVIRHRIKRIFKRCSYFHKR